MSTRCVTLMMAVSPLRYEGTSTVKFWWGGLWSGGDASSNCASYGPWYSTVPMCALSGKSADVHACPSGHPMIPMMMATSSDGVRDSCQRSSASACSSGDVCDAGARAYRFVDLDGDVLAALDG